LGGKIPFFKYLINRFMNTLKLTFSLILIGISLESIAQTIKSEPIFGSIVERKVQKDSTKIKDTFNPLKPAFFRIGVIGGGLVGYEGSATEIGGSTSGFRIEYGFSNRWSLVGEVSGNRFDGVTFSRGQSLLGINWMPFKSRRLQPYFGLSLGTGRDFRGGGRDGRDGRGYYGNDNSYDAGIQGFASVRSGLNYVLFKKIITTVETGYQVPLNNTTSKGGFSLRVGVAYQFSKKTKK
jgi:hypothetical protein